MNSSLDSPTGQPPAEPQTLIFETSPYGNVDAIVEHDGRSVYFYLNGAQLGTRACWVRNLIPGPYVLNVDEVQQGIPPVLPRTHCTYSDQRPLPEPDDLQLVWLEEGNGAALLEKDQLLAVIPPWSGQPQTFDDGQKEVFHGYAAECAAENAICWPIPDHPGLKQRIEQAKQFWNGFGGDDDLFAQLQPKVLAAFDARFRPNSSGPQKYFSIDGGKFPPRGMVQYNRDESTTMLTVGMSLCAQPNVELFSEQPGNFRRIELGLQLTSSLAAKNVEAIQSRLSALAAYPWQQHTWFGPGHTVGLMERSEIELKNGSLVGEFAILLHDSFVRDRLGLGDVQKPQIDMPRFRDDPTNLLWLVPISAEEQSDLAQQKKTAVELVSPERMPTVVFEN